MKRERGVVEVGVQEFFFAREQVFEKRSSITKEMKVTREFLQTIRRLCE